MKIFIILIIMLFLHTFYDFHLQGILAQMKQKKWWKRPVENNKYVDLEESKYCSDYKMALAVHSFEWAFFVQLPMLVTSYSKWCGFELISVRSVLMYISMLILNACVHYAIDDMKANDMSINLIIDQMIHIGQVTFTWIFWQLNVGF